ncbi:Inosamine-phosphate amidinotransferase 1 [Aquicella siphonis]|uniref:Inosamine-phosphate amidinotransferase 1 n=1 Tax=Aquicella siphonis TaxID=254247 RepID=A0A5E4PK92_9COXI|nr:inosamine-phosphate amidinotransferase 1 [Aquicella siphonis]VVC76938.1 Inosamine-phosphate amidinotransferase 1 [Aquicella siphonis]
MSLINVYNEWDPVEEILVGTPLHARMPHLDRGFQVLRQASADLFDSLTSGAIPQQIIEETEEDIQIFIETLLKLNIQVKRPDPVLFEGTFKTLDFEAEHYFSYCPRDILLAIGNTVIETPNVFRSRYFESVAYKNILMEYMTSGARWVAAPKPRLLDSLYNDTDKNQPALKNHEPVFDAANVLRAGKDLFYLVSDSGNELGWQWLQGFLGNDYRVHPCRGLYSSMHIDSTISLLRPGLALINPARVTENNLPPLLEKWDLLIAPEMIEYHYSNAGSFSSVWLGMNLLMLAPDLAVVDSHQLPLIRMLEKHGIRVIPLALRHGRTLGGGFHCITLDVRRKGKLEDYFS